MDFYIVKKMGGFMFFLYKKTFMCQPAAYAMDIGFAHLWKVKHIEKNSSIFSVACSKDLNWKRCDLFYRIGKFVVCNLHRPYRQRE